MTRTFSREGRTHWSSLLMGPRQSPPSAVSPLDVSTYWFLLRSRCFRTDLFLYLNRISISTGRSIRGLREVPSLLFLKAGTKLQDTWMLDFLNKNKSTQLDLIAIRKFVDCWFIRILTIFLQTSLKITSYVANLFLCIFCVGSGCLLAAIGKIYPIFLHQVHQVISQMFSC